VVERNFFTQPKHLENTAQYISDQFEAMGLKVTRKAVELEGAQSQKTYRLRYKKGHILQVKSDQIIS
jgi:hypothetical protein